MKNETKIKALDELFALSSKYKETSNFIELMNFINRFPSLAPFNAFLIHMQNSGVNIVLSAEKWKKYKRTIKINARPLVILIPFGPVEFVYDIADTEGDEIPEYLKNPFFIKGVLERDVFSRTIKNANKETIKYREDLMHKGNAGYATTRETNSFLVSINSTYQLNEKYSTLVHELGHIYSGHLGQFSNSCWDQRLELDHDVVEIEAESISYLVRGRWDLKISSDGYLADYIKKNQPLPNISLDTILTVSNYIEQMGAVGFRPKNKK